MENPIFLAQNPGSELGFFGFKLSWTTSFLWQDLLNLGEQLLDGMVDLEDEDPKVNISCSPLLFTSVYIY
jgi:hypothetical protein